LKDTRSSKGPATRITRSLVALCDGDRSKLAACTQVDELLHIEGVVAANEAKRGGIFNFAS
jgi:hypothetical protein